MPEHDPDREWRQAHELKNKAVYTGQWIGHQTGHHQIELVKKKLDPKILAKKISTQKCEPKKKHQPKNVSPKKNLTPNILKFINYCQNLHYLKMEK